MPLSLLTLPEDVLLAVFEYLPVPAVLRVRQTCRSISEYTRSVSLWKEKLLQVEESEVPIPAAGSVSSPEALVRRALLLRNTLDSHSPIPTHIVHLELSPRPFTSPNDIPSPRLLHAMDARFPPGWAGRLLLTSHIVVIDGVPPGESRRVWVIQVWDVVAATCIGTLQMTARNAMIIDHAPEPGSVRIATLEHSDTLNIYELRPDFTSGKCRDFELIASHPGFYAPLLFEGPTIIARNQDEIMTIFHLFPPADVDTAEVGTESSMHQLVQYCRLMDDSDVSQPRTCMTVHLSTSCIVEFRQRTIAVYPRPDAPSSPSPLPLDANQVPILAPRATHRFQWRLYDVVVRERLHGPGGPALHLLLRFDSYLPWPVNMLHHMVLLPARSAPASYFPAPTPAGDEEWTYSPVPATRGAWPSHIALFARADMAFGRAGLAVWLDSDADGPGQRVAARRLYASGSADTPGEEATPHAPPGSVPLATPAAEHPTEAPGEGALCVLAERGGDGGDDWVRVALCEEEGVVALLAVNGSIRVRMYAEDA